MLDRLGDYLQIMPDGGAPMRRINDSSSKQQSKVIWNVVLAAMLFLGVLLFDHSTDIQYEINEQYLAVAGPEKTVFIELKEIARVECISTDDILSAIGTAGEDEIVCGDFNNTGIGDFSCMVYAEVPQCIVVYHGDEIFIYNSHKEQSTNEAYNKLLKSVNQIQTPVGVE